MESERVIFSSFAVFSLVFFIRLRIRFAVRNVSFLEVLVKIMINLSFS